MNDKKMLRIEVVFNNLDSIIIPSEYIGVFQFKGLKINDRVKAQYWAKQFVVSIDRSCSDYTSECNVTAKECLLGFAYISYIELIYEGESRRDRIYIDWFTQYINHNVNQRSKANKHGDLFLEVSETAELDSIFPDEVINSDDYTVYERLEDK